MALDVKGLRKESSAGASTVVKDAMADDVRRRDGRRRKRKRKSEEERSCDGELQGHEKK
jgi:hypothetical protein